MTNIPESPGGTATTPLAGNPFTADAQAKIASLRAIAETFPDDAQEKPLTKAEIILAATTPIVFLEKAALLSEAAPPVGGALSVDTVFMRRAIASDFAYAGVIDESRVLTQRMETSQIRNKLKAVHMARDIYRLAKGYAKTNSGNAVTPHVLEMKHALRKKRTKKAVKATDAAPAVPVVPPTDPSSTPQKK